MELHHFHILEPHQNDLVPALALPALFCYCSKNVQKIYFAQYKPKVVRAGARVRAASFFHAGAASK
jgi:hypothetical protein